MTQSCVHAADDAVARAPHSMALDSSALHFVVQAVMRSGYERNATWLWFDVGPFGSNPFHANKDKLNLLVHAHGSMLLVDSGRFAYSGDSFSHARRLVWWLAHGIVRVRVVVCFPLVAYSQCWPQC